MKILVSVFLASFSASITVAQAGDVFTCRKIANDAARLDCYDTLFGKTGEGAAKKVDTALTISWSDLQVDYKKMRGQSVTTSGKFLFMGEQGLLYDKNGGMTAFFVNVEKLPRDQLSLLYNNCTSGCDISVSGKVGDVMMQRGITAASVNLED
ncbi:MULTISPECIES: hypothetical protein [Rhizobium]|uniref:Uncharacterized protein n=1 Tax=Rhizobium tropici TaxID=398 RepID=A0A6P1C031_RHITR|nr:MULTISPECIES: hypothetical protein [Rhizobium]MBB4243714.1 hypothetical protein [Rhizobium tropici]MBB5593311.1 hypothetical protein [Rhizobium tropici]MBB6494054.1 hypothetical protein [Rhizobium tropici]NEV09751.1 hypothetical protein [Rhizobium tropici]TGE95955.1 hypothetical protein C9417_17740 [Rhizobium sp. SEMIA 4088]